MILYFFMAVHLILMQVVNLVGGEHLVVWEEVSRYGNKILCNTILTQRVFVIEGYLEATSVVSASEQSLIPLLSPYTLAHCAGCREVSECMRNRRGGGRERGKDNSHIRQSHYAKSSTCRVSQQFSNPLTRLAENDVASPRQGFQWTGGGSYHAQ